MEITLIRCWQLLCPVLARSLLPSQHHPCPLRSTVHLPSPPPRSIEYNVSYVYHSLYAYFDRDNVGLPGMASFFKAASEEEREHAELLMEYQNVRGGRVRLASIIQPEVDFNHAEKVRAGAGWGC